MKVFFQNKYKQWIEIRNRQIFKFNCTCRDFEMRGLFTGNPCKHLREVIKWMDDELLQKGKEKYSTNLQKESVNNANRKENYKHTE